MPDRDAAYWEECLRLCESCLDGAEEDLQKSLANYENATFYAEWYLPIIEFYKQLMLDLHQRRECYLENLHVLAA